MIDETVTDDSSLLNSKVKLPQHVVYRSFPAETVVLNLQTGKYHGLNATAGQMLDQLGKATSVASAAAAMAEAYGQPSELIERDMCELCRNLLERGLIETEDDGGGAAEA